MAASASLLTHVSFLPRQRDPNEEMQAVFVIDMFMWFDFCCFRRQYVWPEMKCDISDT